MTEEQLDQILDELKRIGDLQEQILNLFKAYDTEEFLADEEIRAGISEG